MTADHTGLYCPTCGAVGEVYGFKHFHLGLTMKCPKCAAKWKAESEVCPKCLKPNGFAVPGLCGPCYSVRRDEGV